MKVKKFKRILSFVRPYWGSVTLNIFFNVLSIFFSLFTFSMIVPFLDMLFNPEKLANLPETAPTLSFSSDDLLGYMNFYVGRAIHLYGNSGALIFICILVVVAFFLRNVTTYMAQFFMANVRVGTIRDMRNAVYKKILILPLSFYSKQKKGDIIARISTDIQEIEWSIVNYLDVFIKSPITILVFFLYMLGVSWKLTLFVLVLLPIAGVVIGKIGKSLKKDSKEGQMKFAAMLSTIEETLSGVRIIKAFNALGYSNQKFSEQNDSYTHTLKYVYRKRDMSSPMSEFLSATVIAIVLWFGSTLILNGESTITASSFIAYIIVFSQIISPVKSFSQGFYCVQKGLASAERIFEILDAAEVIVEKPNAISIKEFKSDISYENVVFRYHKDDVLKDISLKIEKGKMVALVGESGGGKTTMVDMLPRFYDVCGGSIKIDGIDIRDYKIDDLRSLMGIVSQESILFNDTVFNNIAFGMKNVSRKAVIEAAKIANAHEFIMRLESGYDTIIGDRGMNLSGGQRQRLSIARAVLKNPPILILDEATSALDTESERLVQDALAKVMSNRTSIVIAHRLSTIQDADEIIVLVKGSIAERGKHDELIGQHGIYKRLTDLQSFN